MRPSTLGSTLLIAGAAAGVVAIGAVIMDYSPSLTPEMMKLLFYNGLGAASVGLMIAGTLIPRVGIKWEKRDVALRGATPIASLRSSHGPRLESTGGATQTTQARRANHAKSRHETVPSLQLASWDLVRQPPWRLFPELLPFALIRIEGRILIQPQFLLLGR